MKKTNFTNPGWIKGRLFALIFLATSLFSIGDVAAQCVIAINDSITVSLNGDCQTVVHPDMVLEYPQNPGCFPWNYVVTVFNLDGTPVTPGPVNNVITRNEVGKTVIVYVMEMNSGNMSAGCKVKVIDKLPPTQECYEPLVTNVLESLDVNDPTYFRTFINPDGSCGGFAPAPLMNPVFYNEFQFVVTKSGSYTFTLNPGIAPANGFYMALYQHYLPILDPCVNVVGLAASGANPALPVTLTVQLTKGVKYFLRTSTRFAGQTGSYTYGYTMPQGGAILQRNYECEYDFYCFESIDQNVFVIPIDNCDLNATSKVVNETTVQNPCNNDNWSPEVVKKTTRWYAGKDISNNDADLLRVTINLLRLSEEDWENNIFFPSSRLFAEGTHVRCDDEYETTEDCCCEDTKCPHPSFTGVPYFQKGNIKSDLYPADLACNMTATYIDIPLNTPNPGCYYKCLRVWTVTEWACQQRWVWPPYIQTIEVVDDTPPVITLCPVSDSITTNTYAHFDNTSFGSVNCAANYKLPKAAATDKCQAVVTWNVQIYNDMGIPIHYLENIKMDNTPAVKLPLGINKIHYTAVDACGNKSKACEFYIKVKDITPPVAVCQQFTTVSLTYDAFNNQGYAKVFAGSFDSGSYDDCKLDSLLVKRMDDGKPCGRELTDNVFRDHVIFCCADVGKTIQIQLRAKDISGNINECMVFAEVQNKYPPVIDCPEPMVVECDFPYDKNNLSKAFGKAKAWNNCGPLDLDSTITWNVDQCGVGTLKRRFNVKGQPQVYCEQTVTFRNSDPFWIDRMNPESTKDDIDWPKHYTAEGCKNPSELTPDVTGRPVLYEGACDLVGATYNDEVFVFNADNPQSNGACLKIIRRWTVIDWCQFEDNNPGLHKKWHYDQVIMVKDKVGPTITSDCRDKFTCTYDGLCQDGYIELLMSATDPCTADKDLKWTYKIDLFKDNAPGSFDYESPVLSGANVQAFGKNQGKFPMGVHRINWTVWDQCGNKSHCSYDFTIMNCKAPTPICIDHLSTTLMPVDTNQDGKADWGMITVKAFDCIPCCLPPTHPCGYRVVTSFAKDTTVKALTFDCDDLGDNAIEIWVSAVLPDGTLLQDFCKTTINIQDNARSCPNTGPIPMASVSGTVKSQDGSALPGVTVSLNGSELPPVVTPGDGTYRFEMPEGGDYNLIPMKDGNDAEGVSTLDLILIQQHLLNLKAFNNPYQMIVSDVNKNGKITASDIHVLRQLIVGATSQLTQSDSWNFVEEGYQFTDPENALNENYPSNVRITDALGEINANFIALKMGDVNFSSNQYGNTEVISRSIEALQLATDEKDFETGELIAVPVYGKNFTDISGFQMTFNFDPEVLSFERIVEGAMQIGNEHIGLTRLEQGNIAFSWNDLKPVVHNPDEVLFTLYFSASKAGSVSKSTSVGSDVTLAEAYNASLDIIGLNWTTRGEQEYQFELFQNNPNPFSNETEIKFSLPEAGFASLKIQDVTGRLVKVISGEFSRGINTVQLKKSELDISGVLYYQLDTEGFTSTRKMVVIN